MIKDTGYLPTLDNERINELDAIRAFALFGILMMNMMSFAGSLFDPFSTAKSESYTGNANEFSLLLINIFVTTNFFTMFSFLFGLGFFIFYTRANEKQVNADLLFIRRLVILLIIGVLHGVFIWYGDILTLYAVTGFWLLLFFRFKSKVNLLVPIVILSIGTLLLILMYASLSFMGDLGLDDMTDSSGEKTLGMLHNAMHGGSYMELVTQNGMIFMMALLSSILIVPIVLAMFLLGLYTGQRGLHKHLKTHSNLLVKIGVIALVIGLPIKVFTGYNITYNNDAGGALASMLAYTIGGPLVAIGLLALLSVLFTKVPALVKFLQPVGKMALTNYILQSVMMVSFFRFTGLFNHLDTVWFIPLAMAVFIIQVGLSHVWLRFFKYGPLEWIWRMLTYLKVMPIKR